MPTKISWTDETWSPVTGCTKVSPGCKHCFAEAIAERFWAKQYPRVPSWDNTSRPRVFTDVQCHPERLEVPLKWRKPRRIFACSMSDLFHEAVPDEFISRVFAVMALASWHQFQVLTKRPERMQALIGSVEFRDSLYKYEEEIRPGQAGCDWPLTNVHAGVTCENQEQLEARVPHLLETPAAVRFLSLEPMLGEIELPRFMDDRNSMAGCDAEGRAISWVIVGGESGPKARCCDVAWIRSVVEQCRAAGVPCWVKQVGRRPVVRGAAAEEGWGPGVRFEEWAPDAGPCEVRTINRSGADPAEWPEDLRVQELPDAGEGA